jgi:heme/copper-type cytochrome/quinol oxidase subunit 2
MKVIKGMVGTAATVGAAMSGQLVITLAVVAVVAVVVVVLVYFVVKGDDDRPAARLESLIRAWRSGGAKAGGARQAR